MQTNSESCKVGGKHQMELTPEQMSDGQLSREFENHSCPGDDSCDICIEYMRRTNPDRLVDLGIDEDPRVDEFD